MLPSSRTYKSFYVRSFALVVGTCFVIELLIMFFIKDAEVYDPMLFGVLDATLLALAILFGLYAWVFPDLVKSKQQTEDLTERTQTLINAIPAPIFYKDENGVYTGGNTSFEAYLGRDAKDIVGQTVYGVAPEHLAKIYHKADMKLMREGGKQIYETSVKHADGTEHDVMFHKAVFAKSSGEVGGIVGIIWDISERKMMERKLRTLASFDDLTQIPNRRELDNRLEQALARAARSDTKVALLFIDMDGFKTVNDRFGHETGDEALRQIAARISGQLRKSDTAGRMGGDEFAVILEGNIEGDTAAMVAEKLLESLGKPYDLGPDTVAHLSASIGIAISPDNGTDLKHLLSLSDQAMYQAKNEGKNRYVQAVGTALPSDPA